MKSITTTGVIEVKFSEPLIIPKEFLNQSVSDSTEAPVGSEDSERRILRKRLEDSMVVRIIPGRDSLVQNLNYTWSISEFEPNDMKIKVIFSQAKFVSIHEDLDAI